ncbi:MAG: ABC transporter ATP-binding protein [Lautropia sp.]
MAPGHGGNPGNVLEVRDVQIGFGGLKVLSGVGLDVLEHGVTALIGPNGAGKTVLFNCISGLYRAEAGSIRFQGKELVGRSARDVARLGIGRSFQNLELFPQLSVIENLLVARDRHFSGGLLQAALHLPRIRRMEIEQRNEVERLINFFELWSVRDSRAGDLAYGQQKIVGFARAMAASPRLLLLDEPGSGLTRDEKEDLARFILRLRNDWGVSILWVEHDLEMVMDLADRVHVLHGGICIASGRPQEVRDHPEVIAAYIGGTEAVR